MKPKTCVLKLKSVRCLSLIKNFDINSYIPESSFPFWLSGWHSGYLCFVRGEEARWVVGGGGVFGNRTYF